MPRDCTPELREEIENTIRFLVVDAVEAAACGHPGAPMALAAAAFELFDNHLRFDPTDPDWPLARARSLPQAHTSNLLRMFPKTKLEVPILGVFAHLCLD